ncbi:hypothetical protein BU26DRAFT_510153 [Trematosphaeria pertusa]|uniref:Uncharacterized protein n=1 Tax=Trematosphaeria pertusa TaxID=390896 RepID=A0A6A6HXJ2_9PLEO|nr:uncharacterized protein BU26DRAFT_510153 [Trematosphaeria pertusa]KAF2242934.1 hypothetical protein BU26DRAFT_510153 [Trematosphaeria pertusa]
MVIANTGLGRVRPQLQGKASLTTSALLSDCAWRLRSEARNPPGWSIKRVAARAGALILYTAIPSSAIDGDYILVWAIIAISNPRPSLRRKMKPRKDNLPSRSNITGYSPFFLNDSRSAQIRLSVGASQALRAARCASTTTSPESLNGDTPARVGHALEAAESSGRLLRWDSASNFIERVGRSMIHFLQPPPIQRSISYSGPWRIARGLHAAIGTDMAPQHP